MSLATTCPACGTCFRVVQDQLKISEGWVRCGHCQEVFNALEGLFELEPAPQASAPPEPQATDATANAPDTPAVAEPDAPVTADDGLPLSASLTPLENPAEEPAWQATEFSGGLGELAAEAPLLEASQGAPPDAPQEHHEQQGTMNAPGVPRGDVAIEPAIGLGMVEPATPAGLDLQGLATIESAAQGYAVVEMPVEAATAMTVFAPDPASLPGFVRLAERRARWERPGVRALLSTVMAALLVGIVAQVAWHWRDRLAYAWPALRPMLTLACSELGCRLQAPRVIDALVVDNASMTRPPGADNYQLAVTLHNRADHPVAAPHLELTLSDGQGGVVIKRVLSPSDFRGADEEAISPQADATWTLEFAARDPGRISGYTVAAFYP